MFIHYCDICLSIFFPNNNIPIIVYPTMHSLFFFLLLHSNIKFIYIYSLIIPSFLHFGCLHYFINVLRIYLSYINAVGYEKCVILIRLNVWSMTGILNVTCPFTIRYLCERDWPPASSKHRWIWIVLGNVCTKKNLCNLL